MSTDNENKSATASPRFWFAHAWAKELQAIEPTANWPDFGPVKEGQAREADDPHVDALANAVDDYPTAISALCLSGGGIRSASFGLGVLQGLARFGLLSQFHYLSTVSGGGYIGSWLSAWRYQAQDANLVERNLNQLLRTGVDAKEIVALRDCSTYLTPHQGILSADTWTALALVIRNFLLNWMVFGPLFLGALFVPKILYQLLLSNAPVTPEQRLIFAGVFLTLAHGVSLYGLFRSAGKWLTDTRYLILVIVPLALSAACFTAAVFGAGLPPDFLRDRVSMGVSGAVLYAITWLWARILAGHAVNPAPGIWEFVTSCLAGTLVGILLALGSDHAGGVRDVLPDWSPLLLGPLWLAFSLMSGQLLFVGLSSFTPRAESNREWLARSSAWMSSVTLSWCVIAVTSLAGPAVVNLSLKGIVSLAGGGVAGIITLYMGASAKSAATLAKVATSRLSLTQLIEIAAVVFAVALGAVLSKIDDVILAQDWLRQTLSSPLARPSAFAAGLLAASILVSYFVNVNRFSLHALYRNRLVRAFLGAGRASAGRDDKDPFTEFAAGDNIHLAELANFPASLPRRLFHVVNVALNVSRTDKLSWQERKAESFTFSPLACGNPLVGYRNTAEYGDPDRGVTLGTAMAISGAAVSPNMGYHSSPLVGFLMMLFNVRLGWWLGNPGTKDFGESGPTPGIVPALTELAGATTDRGDWIYLSDGGHFENLGIYEMVRRRCRIIVVSDAGADLPCAFEDLANALRKSFIDMGVSVTFKKLELATRLQTPAERPYCAVGEITYPGCKTPGWLLYIKPGYHGTEPPDIRGFALSDASFPHDATANQFYGEAQFESYRALGAHIVELMCSHGIDLKPGCDPDSLSFDQFKARVENYVGSFDPVEPSAVDKKAARKTGSRRKRRTILAATRNYR